MFGDIKLPKLLKPVKINECQRSEDENRHNMNIYIYTYQKWKIRTEHVYAYMYVNIQVLIHIGAFLPECGKASRHFHFFVSPSKRCQWTPIATRQSPWRMCAFDWKKMWWVILSWVIIAFTIGSSCLNEILILEILLSSWCWWYFLFTHLHHFAWFNHFANPDVP